jgi:hypothetical protein
MSASRAKPESARSTILTRGHRARICRTMRATSSSAPALASMLERRSLAAKRCRPQNTYAEHVKGQVAIAIIVAMEKAALLMPVDRVIDFARGLGPEGVAEKGDEHGLDRGRVMPDLVIAPARGMQAHAPAG